MRCASRFFVLELLFLVIVGFSTSNADEPLVEPPAQRDVTTYFDELAKSSPMTLEWSADSVEEHHAWQEKFRAKLVQLLGRMPDPVPLEVKWTERRDFEKFTRYKIYVRTERSYWSPVYYFVPQNITHPVPAIVCLHGHSGIYPYIRAGRNEAEQKKTVDAELDYAVYFAEHGYISAAIVVRGWNETAGYRDGGPKSIRSCHHVSMNSFLHGMTPQGLRCWDAMRVIDFLQSQKNVDPTRLAVAGLSGGGTLSMYLPVLEARVKLVMIGGAFSSYRTSIYAMRHCICNCLPGVMHYGDMAEVVALHAPRPVLIINGVRDHIFPIAEAREGFEKLTRVYKLMGAEDRLEADFFDGPHAWSNRNTLPFLTKHFGVPGT